MYSAKTTCLFWKDTSSFLKRLKIGIIRAKIKWQYNNDPRDIDSLYPLLKQLDSIRMNDNISLQKRIRTYFSRNRTSLKGVLSELYSLEKKYRPIQPIHKNISLSEIRTLLSNYKKYYFSDLKEYEQDCEKAQEEKIKILKSNIEDLKKYKNAERT
ncbi:MAG: hypothetical protein ACRCSV_04720 [Chlamydiales bacterium]